MIKPIGFTSTTHIDNIKQGSPAIVYMDSNLTFNVPIYTISPTTLEAISNILTQVMDQAVANGANSVSMPDEYVEVAAWLCGVK